MKKITAKHFYPFDTETLLQAFKDEAIMRAKFEDSGAKDVSIAISETSTGFGVEINRKIPAEVPAAFKSVFGDWNDVKQIETWTGSPEQGYQCELTIEIKDVPTEIKGRMDITFSGVLTTNEVMFDVSCAIPLVGGQLAEFVGGNIKRSVEQEFEFIKEHLG